MENVYTVSLQSHSLDALSTDAVFKTIYAAPSTELGKKFKLNDPTEFELDPDLSKKSPQIDYLRAYFDTNQTYSMKIRNTINSIYAEYVSCELNYRLRSKLNGKFAELISFQQTSYDPFELRINTNLNLLLTEEKKELLAVLEETNALLRLVEDLNFK